MTFSAPRWTKCGDIFQIQAGVGACDDDGLAAAGCWSAYECVRTCFECASNPIGVWSARITVKKKMWERYCLVKDRAKRQDEWQSSSELGPE